jgi:hypothetical protein
MYLRIADLLDKTSEDLVMKRVNKSVDFFIWFSFLNEANTIKLWRMFYLSRISGVFPSLSNVILNFMRMVTAAK